MSVESTASETRDEKRGGIRWPHVLLIILATVLVTFALSYWFLSQYLFLKEFKPVTLSAKEEIKLDRKLRAIGFDIPPRSARADSSHESDFDAEGNLRPEPYTEIDASREVTFNEKELNAVLARNTDLARKLAIDLSDDLVSARLLIPLDPDFPFMGGKTLRVNAGVEMAYQDSKPIVILKGVSVMGVPVPNAWLGNLKNVDVVSEFGTDRGFWKTFSDGVDNIRVEQGKMKIKLKE